MTPAVHAARKAGIPFAIHEYRHDPRAESYGLEAAEALGLDVARVFKTLVVAPEGQGLWVAVVPVAGLLDLKALAQAAGAKRASMADPKAAERATGYLVGGISPLGQRQRLSTVVDLSALDHQTIFVSAGRRGLEIELAPSDLVTLCAAAVAPVGRLGGAGAIGSASRVEPRAERHLGGGGEPGPHATVLTPRRSN